MSIADALRHPDSTIAIAGVTTTRVGLLDSDSRRITIQDASAAILVRLPADAAAPAVGTRMRISGKVGAYYGAPQLDADSQPVVLGQGPASPLLIRRVPSANDEWSLVRVTVRITNVSKNGDSWRTEASLESGGSMPVVGLANSGIPSSALVEGRQATITGIVKRAYPTASDQRFALVPRTTADIVIGAAPGPSPTAAQASPGRTGTTGSTGNLASDTPPAGRSPSLDGDSPLPGGSAPASGDAAVDGGEAVPTTIEALPNLIGQRVRIGGRVTTADGSLASISDGTGETSVRFVSEVDAAAVALVPDELVNVIGWDAEQDVGGTEVVVTTAADVSRAPAFGDSGVDPSQYASDLATATPAASDGSDLVSGIDETPEPARGMPAVAVGLAAALAAAGLMLVAGTATYVRRRKLLIGGTRHAGASPPGTGPNPAAGPNLAVAADAVDTLPAGPDQP